MFYRATVAIILCISGSACGPEPSQPKQENVETNLQSIGSCAKFFVPNSNGVIGRSFVLPENTECQLYPTNYKFDEIEISNGSKVSVIKNVKSWLVMEAEDRVKIDGSIIYAGIPDTKEAITTSTANGITLSYQYPRLAEGGSGGSGITYNANNGQYLSTCNNHRYGSPTNGTTEYGGGGAGGAGINAHANDAQGFRGGNFLYKGGDGGRKKNVRNGGLVYIISKVSISGTGEILVDGDNGEDGEKGSSNNVCGTRPKHNAWSVSGAGGGGPAADGGFIWLDALSCPHGITMSALGGTGGLGGWKNENPITAGKDGDDGEAGHIIDCFSPNEPEAQSGQ